MFISLVIFGGDDHLLGEAWLPFSNFLKGKKTACDEQYFIRYY